MNDKNIEQIMSIGMKDGKYLTCQMTVPFQFDELITAAICNLIMDYLISNVPENKQVEFEKETYKLFCEVFEKRFNYIEHIV